jgi:biopolymer transport protein ExbD
MKIKPTSTDTRVAIDMTPMIDIVFQLLAFFIMTLRIGAAEGDFNIKMPLAAPRAAPIDENLIPPIKLYLTANAQGDLVTLAVNADPRDPLVDLSQATVFRGPDRFRRLHNFVAGQVGDGSLASSAEVELVCDYGLRYEFVIDAITAVSGSVGPDGRIIKLVEKIKFAPPRE